MLFPCCLWLLVDNLSTLCFLDNDVGSARQLKALTLVFASMATSSVQRKDLHKSNKNMYLKFGYALSRAGDSALQYTSHIAPMDVRRKWPSLSDRLQQAKADARQLWEARRRFREKADVEYAWDEEEEGDEEEEVEENPPFRLEELPKKKKASAQLYP